MENFYGLILAGGSGTRLWPISRDYYPKQFLSLIGNKTLIQQTFSRLKKIIPPERIYISTNRIFIDEILNQLEPLGINKKNIIIQPTDKNTGPAIAQSARFILNQNPKAIIVNCPADHLIKPEALFTSSLKTGYALANEGKLVTFGVVPTAPNSGYGYIAKDTSTTKSIENVTTYKVKRFIEKPTIEKSRELIKNGSLWNSGIFIWQASVILDEVKKLSPKTYKATLSRKSYFSLVSDPVDKTVMEKSDKVWVVPVSFNWEDIGSWNALYELLPKDKNKNVLNEFVTAYNCSNSLIYGTPERKFAAIGVKDMIIVDTNEDLLVSHRDSISDMKEALKQAQLARKEEAIQNPLISIITPTYNDAEFLENTFQSVFKQKYKNLEYIVVDGNSRDKTQEILDKFSHKIEQLVTLPESSHFERINKGISLANGEIIGILDADDAYSDDGVISDVIQTMIREVSDVAWGELVYSDKSNINTVSMYWKSSSFVKGSFRKGWAPPFPTFFARKEVYEKYGLFKNNYKVAAEYEMMLRLLEKHKVKGSYIPRILVKMTGRGLTLKSIYNRVRGNYETYKSLQKNNIQVSPFFLSPKT